MLLSNITYLYCHVNDNIILRMLHLIEPSLGLHVEIHMHTTLCAALQTGHFDEGAQAVEVSGALREFGPVHCNWHRTKFCGASCCSQNQDGSRT